MLNTLLNQLVKNVMALPGWIPLILLFYGAANYVDIQFLEDVNTEKLVKNTIAILMALFSYQLGDAIDKAFYKKFERDRIDAIKSLVRDELKIKDGIYRIMKAFVDAQDEYTGSCIQVYNESAKLIRSLILVFIVLGVIAISKSQIMLGFGLMLFGVFSLYIAFFLKLKHKIKLYGLVGKTTNSEKYNSQLLEEGIRLFFWEGNLIGSAMDKASTKNSTRTLTGVPED
ncbi:hypothetical protein GCM10011348_34900 [Marinobacterium nitratireducens]|uniref:Uncharacterized protein n=1 Tax=Marinobacterium nitratireducens TaxID=518897 RepID=A0A917ZKS3_9GAMM|nr:hypothetical protein [Marinobacterium nitratireducens]GGO85713.1 hypothetical protein GCM10011348_34900 [Marinobacterium nitratireducens]